MDTKTFKNKNAVVFDGHTYRKGYEKEDGTVVWRCRTKDGEAGCTGRGEKRGNNDFRITKRHWVTCVQDDDGVEVKKRKMDMKASVDGAPLQPTRVVYNNGLQGASDRVKARMPVLEKQKREIDRWKGKHVPAAPVNVADFVLPPIFRLTRSGDRNFYRHMAADKSLVIFGCDRDLLRLAAADLWFGDGFHSIPLYEQVYVIGSKDDGIFLPAIYALCMRKNTETYVALLVEMKTWAAQLGTVLNPTHFRTDFEMAVRNAVAQELPNTQITGCQFHHADAIWSWNNTHGFSVLYRTNAEFRDMVQMLMVVCFLPADDIALGVDRLEQTCAPAVQVEFGQVLAYYRNYWLGQWGPDAICHYQDFCRTNNDVESFNRTMRRVIGHNTTNVNKLVEMLHKEEDATNTKLLQLAAHPGEYVVRRNKKYAAINREIATTFDNYAQGHTTIARFLSRIAFLSNPTFFNDNVVEEDD